MTNMLRNVVMGAGIMAAVLNGEIGIRPAQAEKAKQSVMLPEILRLGVMRGFSSKNIEIRGHPLVVLGAYFEGDDTCYFSVNASSESSMALNSMIISKKEKEKLKKKLQDTVDEVCDKALK